MTVLYNHNCEGGDEVSNIKVLTVRVPLNLNKKLEERAVREDLSKNQVVKQALRMYLDLKN